MSELRTVTDKDWKAVTTAGQAEQIGDAIGIVGRVLQCDDVGMLSQAINRIEWNRLMRGGGNIVKDQGEGHLIGKSEKVRFRSVRR